MNRLQECKDFLSESLLRYGFGMSAHGRLYDLNTKAWVPDNLVRCVIRRDALEKFPDLSSGQVSKAVAMVILNLQVKVMDNISRGKAEMIWDHKKGEVVIGKHHLSSEF